MRKFWREFLKGDNSQVHTPYACMAIAFILATPIVFLSCAAVIHHLFLNNKPLDAPTVQLLLGLLGAATGGIIGSVATMFSKTVSTVSNITSIGPAAKADAPSKGPM